MTVDMYREYDISIFCKCLLPAAHNVEFWNRCAKENPKRKGIRNADLDTGLQVFKFGRPDSQFPRRDRSRRKRATRDRLRFIQKCKLSFFVFFFALFRHVNSHVLRGGILLAIVCKQQRTPRIFLQKTPCNVFVRGYLHEAIEVYAWVGGSV